MLLELLIYNPVTRDSSNKSNIPCFTDYPCQCATAECMSSASVLEYRFRTASNDIKRLVCLGFRI